VAAQNMPAAEVEIDEGLVRRLLDDQHPDLAHLPLSLVANGWDNAIFRLGPDMTVRLPRRQLAADLVVNEQRWLPELAPRLPIPIPTPLRIGQPHDVYPWRWSVGPWFDGEVAADVVLADPVAQAHRLGGFVAALHTPAPIDAPLNAFRRGQPIAELRPLVVANIERLGASIDGVALEARFDELVDVDEWLGEPVWLHGDLHSANMLVRDGAICAVIDFGDVTSGDPAVDLAIGWMLFDADARPAFRSSAGALDDATWSRAEAWALHFALLYLLHSADNPRFTRMGTHLIERLAVG
jgi:aminoglycoside phosphotransferase (APT) family kinase protein